MNNNNIDKPNDAPSYNHLDGATKLLNSITADVKENPRLLTPEVATQIKVAEEALAEALSKIYAAKEEIKIQEQAKSKVDFNTYFGDLNGKNFANMAELNAAIRKRYIELFKNTKNGADNKIGISEFRNNYGIAYNDVSKLDESALAEINFEIGNVPYKLLLLGYRAYLSRENHKHTILLYSKNTYTINGKTIVDNKPYELEYF